MKCYRCKTKNSDNARLCRYCGAPLYLKEVEREEEYDEEEPRKKISFFTMTAYRALASQHRYWLIYGVLACFAFCLTLFALMLSEVGGGASNAVALLLMDTTDAQAVAKAFEAWRYFWSVIVVLLISAAGMAFSVAIGYKMIKIAVVFRQKKRAIVPLDTMKKQKEPTDRP